ncbi:trypsin-like peptidase domain-containing protein [Ruminococcus sp.]|uniref:S1C family serine protease n=1 Tax=Ruminococcus sp. TaxID=41978 RepID=UPI0025CE95B2|nr:trypsin-like peptidase domain-containing protein [Ruminococcus sp.]
MDNFDNNNMGGFEPQKPFTERPVQNNNLNTEQNMNMEQTIPVSETETQEEQAQNVQPQNGNTPYGDYIFGNNNQNTANDANPTENIPPQNQNPSTQPWQYGYGQYPYSGQNPQYNQNNQQYGQYQNNTGYNQNVPPYQQNMYGQPPYGNNGTYNQYNSQYNPQMYAQYPQKKTNGGIVALIIVLCSLLAIGFIGMMVYGFSVGIKEDLNNDRSDSGNSFRVPNKDSTTPFETLPNTSSQGKTHDESDYSDKVNKDYSGMKLESNPKDTKTNDSYTAAKASEKVSDSVVGILCYSGDVPDQADTTTASSQGSGIIFSQDGYVITNAHVIGNSKTAYAIRVVTSDGKVYKAGVVGYDSRTDIAVLKMDDAKGLTPATFGDSSQLEVGQDIIVVGNPGGLDYQNTTTKGVISALDRKLSTSSLTKYIQTDAAINPGNSGGPLVNYYGQVVGITTSKIVSETYEGMGFAIPSQTVKSIVDTLVKNGYVEGRVKIGISGIAVTSDQASNYNIPQGIYVQSIVSGGPCDGTSLKEGDIITEVDGETITSFADVYAILETHKPGDKIKVKYYSSSTGNGEIEITLQEDK